MSNSLRPRGLQQARYPFHQQLPEFTQTYVHWVADAIQPSHPLWSPSPPAPQSLPASESFPMSQLFAWGGQSIGVTALASFLPKNTQDWSPLEWTGCISLQSKGLSRVFSNSTVQKHQFFGAPKIKTLWYWWWKRHKDQQDRIENPNINLYKDR